MVHAADEVVDLPILLQELLQVVKIKSRDIVGLGADEKVDAPLVLGLEPLTLGKERKICRFQAIRGEVCLPGSAGWRGRTPETHLLREEVLEPIPGCMLRQSIGLEPPLQRLLHNVLEVIFRVAAKLARVGMV